jgi:hypothetical protein
VKQAICLVRTVPTASFAPSSSQISELEDEPAQLRRFADATKAWFQRAHEEKEKATVALQKEKVEVLVQLREVQESVVAYESEKLELQAKLQEENKTHEAQLQKKRE